MSLCDNCKAPGACCTKMALSGGWAGPELDAMKAGRPSHADALNFAAKNGVPFFVPTEAVHWGRGQWFWRYRCTKLTAEGRCSIYRKRPELCRRFEAGSDPLCVHYAAPAQADPERAAA